MFKEIRNPFLYFIIFSSAVLAITNCFLPLTDDVSLHLFHSLRMVESGGLYERWAEVMPPTIYVIYSIPVYFSKLTGLNHTFSVNFCVDCLSVISLFLINHSLKKNLIEGGLRKHILMAALCIFFVLPVFTFSVNDRDTLFLILCYPWLINKILKNESSLPVIIFAAIGFSIKQYNYLYPLVFILLIENFDRNYFRRIFSKENLLLAAAIMILNIAFIIKFTAYYTELLPVLLVSYKGIHAYSYGALIYSVFIFLVIIFFLVRSEHLRKYLKSYLILIAISIMVVSLNGNSKYNANHPIALAILIIFHLINSSGKEQTRYTLKLLMVMAVSGVLLLQVLILYFFIKITRNEEKDKVCHQQINNYTKDPYIFLSVENWAFQQRYSDSDEDVYDNKNHMFAIDHLWMLPWLYNNKEDPKAYIVKNYLRKKMVEALGRGKDVSIMVDLSKFRDKIPEGFNILDFFRSELHLENELKGFKKIADIDKCGPTKIEVWRKAGRE